MSIGASAKWDIEQFQAAFLIDADWGIPPGGSFGILIQLKMLGIDQFVYNSINHSHAINHQSFQLSHFQFHMHFRIIISKIYSFHIIFHIYLVYYQNTRNKDRVSEQTKVVGFRSLPFDLDPRLGDPHPSLVNSNHATLSG